jgi:hypothetical protein
MPAVPAPQRRSRLAARLLPSRSTITATTPTLWPARRAAIASAQLRSARCRRIRGDCTRCTATSGSGAPTGMPSTRSEPQVDPRGPAFGRMRVLRGGTWSDPARYARSATRSRIEPAYRPRSTGFRMAMRAILKPAAQAGRTDFHLLLICAPGPVIGIQFAASGAQLDGATNAFRQWPGTRSARKRSISRF